MAQNGGGGQTGLTLSQTEDKFAGNRIHHLLRTSPFDSDKARPRYLLSTYYFFVQDLSSRSEILHKILHEILPKIL